MVQLALNLLAGLCAGTVISKRTFWKWLCNLFLFITNIYKMEVSKGQSQTQKPVVLVALCTLKLLRSISKRIYSLKGCSHCHKEWKRQHEYTVTAERLFIQRVSDTV